MIGTIPQEKIGKSDKIFHLKKFQDDFIFSEKRFVGFVGGWGTGKDFSTIARLMRLAEESPGNQLLIVRAEFVDLRDSTMIDFEKYTGIKIDSTRNARLSNGSIIMFRHGEELEEKNLNNMNLGGFAIVQADEFDSDVPWFKLCGRLRKCHGTCEWSRGSKKIGCDCKQSGCLSANANGEDWIARLFGSPELGVVGVLGEDAELVEARSVENADVLPVDYVNSWEVVRISKPEIYERYVMNSRKIGDDKFVVLPLAIIDSCRNLAPLVQSLVRRVTVCDPSEGDSEIDSDDGEGGGDETVIYDLEGPARTGQEIYRHVTLPDTMGRIIFHAKKNNSTLVCVDKIGIGAMLYQQLCEVYAADRNVEVYGFDGRLSPPEGEADTYENYKTYAWFKARQMYLDRVVSHPEDPELRRQIAKIRYRYTNGAHGGKYVLWPKVKMKKLLGCSPDRADAWVMGLDALARAGNSVAEPVRRGLISHPVYQGFQRSRNPYEGLAVRERRM